MTKSSVPEADGVNSVRSAETFPSWKAETKGAEPRPIRKRGFWRAYRRKELWAIVPCDLNKAYMALIRNMVAEIYSDSYFPAGNAYIIWPLSKIVGDSND